MIFLAVTGGRNFSNKKLVYNTLNEYKSKDMMLVLGDATGVDALARQWAIENKIPFVVHYANWGKYGKAAGPLRNKEMISQANMLLSFPGSRGTVDCTRQAEIAGIPIRRINETKHQAS